MNRQGTMTSIKFYIYALRPQQWIKNFFVLLPLVFSQSLIQIASVGTSILAFTLFCMASSSVYTLNDLIDLEKDRVHPTKKLRPLASGKISAKILVAIGLILAISSIYIAFKLNAIFGFTILSYLAMNLIYSLALKEMVIVDVMCIAFFFLLRVIAGAVVIQVEVSHWLLICTATLALFLGFNKRRHELSLLGARAHTHRAILEAYSKYFIDQMIAVITASTVIFYTLYTVDPITVSRFNTKNLLFTIPFVYYGIFRYLYLIHKRGQGGDPTRIILKDHKMIINLGFWLLTIITVIYLK